MKPTISVIIPTRNRAAYVSQAIESVLRVGAQLGQGDRLEVIVVDNGSTDDTTSVVARYPVRLIACDRLGPSAARNAGIRVANGEFVAFLDDDDVWLDGHLVQHLRILRGDPAIALVFAQGILTDAELNPVYEPEPKAPLPSGDIVAFTVRQPFSFTTVVARRAVLEEAGCFDENIRYAEDWDLQFRIAARHHCAGIAVPVALWRQSNANATDLASMKRRYASERAVFRRGVRSMTRARLPLRARLTASMRISGIFAYWLCRNAQSAVERGEPGKAARNLAYAARIAPLHCALRTPGFWSISAATAIAALKRLSPSRMVSRRPATSASRQTPAGQTSPPRR